MWFSLDGSGGREIGGEDSEWLPSHSAEVPLQVELIVLRGSSKSPDVFVSERLFLKIGWKWGLAYNPGLGSWRRLPAGRCMLGGRCDGFVPHSSPQPTLATDGTKP